MKHFAQFKTVAVILLLMGSLGMHAQTKERYKNYIYPKQGKRIRIEFIHDFNERVVRYVKDGSLHDILIGQVKYLDWNGQIIRFNKFNKPMYQYYQKYASLSGSNPVSDPDPDQEPTGNKEYRASNMNKHTVFLRPMALLEGYGKAYGGFNSRIKEGVYVKNGIGVMVHDWGSTEALNYGFELRSELKLVVSSEHYHNRFEETYFGFNAGYKFVSYDQWEYYYNPYNPSLESINRGEYYAHVGMFNLKVGRQTMFRNGFFIDMYAGLGARAGNTYSNYQLSSRLNVMLGLDIGLVLKSSDK